MSFSYNPALPTDLDHVRFLIGDTTTPSEMLQDEEITAVLSEETATGKALKYFAAARALQVLSTRWAAAGRGVTSKSVSQLSKTWGIDGNATQVLEARIKELRERGAFLLSPSTSYPFRVGGDSTSRIRPR